MEFYFNLSCDWERFASNLDIGSLDFDTKRFNGYKFENIWSKIWYCNLNFKNLGKKEK